MATEDEKRIRQYAHEGMNPEEAGLFEARLKTEPGLQDDLEVYLALQAREAVAQKQRWQQLKAAQGPARIIKPFWQRPALWLSAAAAMLALAALVWVISRPDPDASKLAEAYLAQGYPPPEIAMGTVDADSLWRAASEAYRHTQYEAAAQAILRIATPSSEQVFYLGLCYLFSQPPDYRAAISAFGKVEGNYQEAATYYSALAHLKSGEEENARKLLLQIREGERKEEVEKLLQSLSKN